MNAPNQLTKFWIKNNCPGYCESLLHKNAYNYSIGKNFTLCGFITMILCAIAFFIDNSADKTVGIILSVISVVIFIVGLGFLFSLDHSERTIAKFFLNDLKQLYETFGYPTSESFSFSSEICHDNSDDSNECYEYSVDCWKMLRKLAKTIQLKDAEIAFLVIKGLNEQQALENKKEAKENLRAKLALGKSFSIFDQNCKLEPFFRDKGPGNITNW